jgi:hypothetical protein
MSARRVARRVSIAIAGGKSAAVAGAAMLASSLWIGVTVPSLSPLPSSSGSAQQLIAISLQSALLGIDDQVARAPAAGVLAAASTLGLASPGLDGLTPESLRLLAKRYGTQVPATGPLVIDAHLDPRSQAPAPTPPEPASQKPAPTSAQAATPVAATPSSDSGASHAFVPSPTDLLVDPPASTPPNADSRPPLPSGTTPTLPTANSGPRGGAQQAQVPLNAPVIDFHAQVTAEATSAAGALVAYTTPSARDGVGGSVAVSCAPAAGTSFPLGTTSVTCSAQTGGEVVRESFSVVVRDTTPPALRLPGGITAVADSPDGAAVSFTTTANDVVDGALATVCQPASGSVFPVGSTEVTCTAKDAAGNVARGSFTVAVGATPETTPPAFAARADVLAEATGPSGAAVTFTAPTATDPMDGAVPVSCLPVSGSVFPLGTTTVTCGAQNAGGERAQLSFRVTVTDTTPPALQLPAGISVAATSAAGAVVAFSASASDLVDGAVLATCLPSSGSVFAPGSTEVTCSAADNAGNLAYSSFVVVVGNAPDTTAPELAPHADAIVEATSTGGAVVTYSAPLATDDRDGSVPASCLPASGTLLPLGITTVSCSAQDAAGNRATTTFVVRVRDTTPPTIAAHAGVTTEATSSSGATVSYSTPSATDNLDGSVAVSCQPGSGTVFALGSTTVDCSARDAAGNGASSTFTVLVQDTTPPTVATHANLTAEATDASGAAVSFTAPTATDNLDGSLAVSCQPGSGSTFPLGPTQVTCSAQDSAGNWGSSTFTVTVQDTTPPALQLPADLSAAPTDPQGAVVTYSASATDLVDGSVSVSCSPDSGSEFPLGSTTVTCSAQDGAGNTGSGSFVVWVGNGAPPPDTTPPTITAHANVTAEATGPGGATVTYASPTANDNRDGSVSVSCLPASGSLFPLGGTTVTCSARDAAGNGASSTFTVTVGDTTPPTVASHANVTVEATGPAGVTVSFTAPTATDVVDGSVSASCLPGSGGIFPLGTTTVTCSARDAAGNTGSSTFTVVVRDTTAPTVASHANLTVEATGPGGATVTYSSPTATDTVDGSVSVSCLPASGGAFPLGSTTVTCSAQDAAGNSAASTFTVLVRDTTPPTLQVPTGLTVDATSSSGATVSLNATATDLVDGSDQVTCVPASGSTFSIGQTTVTCNARDAAGNAAPAKTFTVAVQDAGAQLTELNQLITAMNLEQKFANSLLTLVNKAAQHVTNGNGNDANKQLLSLTKTVIDQVAKADSKLTVPQGAEIVADANRIRIVIGAVSGGSVIPPAEASLFNVFSVLKGFGLTGPPVDSQRTKAGQAGDHLVANNVHDACTTLASMVTTAGSGPDRLPQADVGPFDTAVNAVQQILGC